MLRLPLGMTLLAAFSLVPFIEAAQAAVKKAPHHDAAPTESPLNDREKAAQVLNRFTFGLRPGDLNAVMKIGPDAWFEQQLDPGAIPDASVAKAAGRFSRADSGPGADGSKFPR